jgi:hypothetical protein
MHPPTNVNVDLNEVIEKLDILQNITVEGLPKYIIPLVSISRTFQYYHQILESNTFKSFKMNRYQLMFAPALHFTDFKFQGQTFDHLIIKLKQPYLILYH